jgi:CO dehydrogenase nickel-insertion accessory protein CooC1
MAKASQTTAENGESTIHLTLQGKGGVGKSLIAAILAQFFQNSGRDVRCMDTDPVNRTFAQYAALSADRLQLRDEHNRIDQRAFDTLMERFLTEDTRICWKARSKMKMLTRFAFRPTKNGKLASLERAQALRRLM